MKGLTSMGYKATDATKQALIDGLDSVEEITGGSVVKAARDASRSAVYEMNAIGGASAAEGAQASVTPAPPFDGARQ